MVKVPPQGYTGKCMQPQRKNDTTGEWLNNGFPVTVYDAKMAYKVEPDRYVGSSRTKRFCYLIPVEIETEVSFTLNEEYK